jgi:hypothetical protein
MRDGSCCCGAFRHEQVVERLRVSAEMCGLQGISSLFASHRRKLSRIQVSGDQSRSVEQPDRVECGDCRIQSGGTLALIEGAHFNVDDGLKPIGNELDKVLKLELRPSTLA